ncbi:MAG TPA: heme ABC transporter permease CcmC [Actinomycetota bacterium]|nr:heme ABC transporter permease CcmC [Actinomycetota bacterium]
MSAAERAMGRIVARPGERALGWAAAAALAASAVLSLAVAPPDAQQGQVQRLMYVHVPTAWLAYLAFAVVFVASIAYLRTKRSRWDRLAAASAELGVLFTALTILLGSLWARPVWGTWWTWDPRLTTTAVLLLIYLGYLAVRRLTDSPPRRARWAAVVGIVGFIDVPIVHLSVQWWRSLHQGPTVARLGGPTIAPVMLATLLVAVAAFTLAYLYLLALRLRVGRVEERTVAEALSPRIGRPAEDLLDDAAGAPVEPAPRGR